MSAFYIIALVFAIAAAAFVLVPLLRAHFGHQATDARPGFTIGTGVVVAALLPVAAVLLYGKWTTWRWDASPATRAAAVDEAHSLDEAMAALTARLEAQPDDIEGWRMLGRSYMQMQRFEDAAEAYRRVVSLSIGDPAARIDYAEARVLTDEAGIAGPIGDELIALAASAPDNPKGAWYAGLAEFERGNDEAGRAQWLKLLTPETPEQIRQIVEQRLGVSPAAAPPAMATAPTRPADAGPVDDASRIELDVTIDPTLAPRLDRPVALFIFARTAVGGPPLAVIRRDSTELPLKIDLSDANTMVDGMSLNDHATLRLVARLSLGGGPGAQAGDMFGEVDYTREEGSAASIVIDQVVP